MEASTNGYQPNSKHSTVLHDLKLTEALGNELQELRLLVDGYLISIEEY